MNTPEHSPEDIAVIKSWLGSGSINFFGMPASGKDDQAERLQALVGGTVLSGGLILRHSIIPDEIEQAMNSGVLIPSDEYVKIVLPYLSSPELAGAPLILSAVGRMHGEELSVMNALDESGHELKAVVHLSLSEHHVHERLSSPENLEKRGNRADDKPEVIGNRISEFTDKTLDVIEFYREKGLLIEVDARQSKVAVSVEVVKLLAQKAHQR